MIEIDGNELYQWDTGRRVVVTGIEVEHVHFANQGDSKAVIMGAVDIHAQIPDFLLQSGKQLCVYAVKDGITVESKTFYVKKRERPENYVYEDDQRNYIYELVTNAEEAIESMWWAYQDTTLATENANLATENANNSADRANLAAKNANETAYKAEHTAKSLMVIGSAKGDGIYLDDAVDQFFVGMRIFGKTTQDGAPKPEAPVEIVSTGDDGSVRVTVCCKNLLENTAVKNSINGVTFTVNTDGSITANGTATKDVYCRVGEVICDLGSRYTLSGAPITANVNKFFLYKSTANVAVDSGAGVDFYALEEINEVYIKVLAGVTLSNDTFYPMVRLSSVMDSTYEQYKGQTLTASTPNGLRGIPVAAGGNCIDTNGQQWICDEIDLERGVYVQRVKQKTFDGSIDELWWTGINHAGYAITVDDMAVGWRQNGYCDRFQVNSTNDNSAVAGIWFGVNNNALYVHDVNTLTQNVDAWKLWLSENPVTIQYILSAPIETPLPAEDLTAYAALRTYRGNTTVSNDASAHMDIEYAMDAKTYISRVITGITSAARVVNISLPASKWVGSGNLYSQGVSIDGITVNSQVNLTPSVEQISIFYEKDVTFITENDGGIVTVYVIGQKPTNDYTIKASIVEVIA